MPTTCDDPREVEKELNRKLWAVAPKLMDLLIEAAERGDTHAQVYLHSLVQRRVDRFRFLEDQLRKAQKASNGCKK